MLKIRDLIPFVRDFVPNLIKPSLILTVFPNMKQMKIDPEKVIDVEVTGAAIALKPVVFKEGDSYCCLLGADPQKGIFGCGDTPEDALKDWDTNLAKHLATAGENDEIVKHVKSVIEKLNQSVDSTDRQVASITQADIDAHIASIEDEETADEIRRFYNQFKL